MKTPAIIAADVGNSRLKLLAGSVARAAEYSSVSGEIRGAIEDALRGIYPENSGNSAPVAAFSSVNPPVFEVFSAAADSFGFVLFDAAEAARESTLLSFTGISGMGGDRMLGLFGARAVASPPFITVDCGTAVTVNAVDNHGVCIGGVIFPGLRAQLTALTEKTANLRSVPLFWEEFSAGTTTEQAIRRGIIHGVAGGILHCVGEISAQLGGDNIPVFLTGGGAELLRIALSRCFTVEWRPNLVCEGALSVAEHHCKSHNN